MGKSYRNEKNFGPKRKRNPGGHFNPRREERQRIRHESERKLEEIVDKFKNNLDVEDLEDFESFKITYENGKNGKVT